MKRSSYWIVLLFSAVFEAVWATALAESEGFTRLIPSIVFVVASVISFLGLGYAMKAIPISVSYTVWTGVGAALTVLIAVMTGRESMNPLKFVFLAGIILCVIGLKIVDDPGRTPVRATQESEGTDSASVDAAPLVQE